MAEEWEDIESDHYNKPVGRIRVWSDTDDPNQAVDLGELSQVVFKHEPVFESMDTVNVRELRAEAGLNPVGLTVNGLMQALMSYQRSVPVLLEDKDGNFVPAGWPEMVVAANPEDDMKLTQFLIIRRAL